MNVNALSAMASSLKAVQVVRYAMKWKKEKAARLASFSSSNAHMMHICLQSSKSCS